MQISPYQLVISNKIAASLISLLSAITLIIQVDPSSKQRDCSLHILHMGNTDVNLLVGTLNISRKLIHFMVESNNER